MYPQVEAFENTIARRFKIGTAKTAFANTVSKDPIAISWMELPRPMEQWSETPDPECAFSVHINMTTQPKCQVRIGGGNTVMRQAIGDVCLFDLSTSPIVLIQDPMQWLRVQISQRTLDDLAYDRGQPPIAGLRTMFGNNDPVLYALSCALARRQEIYGEQDPLFLDHVALAFHAHVAQVYGQLRNDAPLRGGLAPWQFRRARDLMRAKLSEGVTIAELAEACGLSVSYFARAFRRSAGMPAHKWLLKMRVERAKSLLLDGSMELSEIALECGFVDQSHLSKVFSLREGHAPGRWRRLRLD